jgi:hypothetical protein
MQAEVFTTLWPHILKSLMGVAITGFGALMLYPVRYVKREWKSLKDAIADTHAELILQRTNCLTTIGSQGEKQIELLSRAVNTLEAIHLGQVEMSGYIKASNDRK